MNDQTFSLIPFGKDSTLDDLEVIGTISRRDPYLLIQYTVLGSINQLVIPASSAAPQREDNLWQTTCFEFFLGIKNDPNYWEFNLSPTGNWNIYRFESYRQGMREESAYNALPFIIEIEQDALSLSLNLDLDEIIPIGQMLNVGISAVTQLKDDKITHWALAHSGTKADFHRREDFSIKL